MIQGFKNSSLFFLLSKAQEKLKPYGQCHTLNSGRIAQCDVLAFAILAMFSIMVKGWHTHWEGAYLWNQLKFRQL